jgi:hypothetical protein
MCSCLFIAFMGFIGAVRKCAKSTITEQDAPNKMMLESAQRDTTPWEMAEEWLFDNLYEELCHDLFE